MQEELQRKNLDSNDCAGRICFAGSRPPLQPGPDLFTKLLRIVAQGRNLLTVFRLFFDPAGRSAKEPFSSHGPKKAGKPRN
ncbi:MAG: hypothetical protein DWI24_08335 [Planctomycetota bacterium]|nr:MAG: hypothetical protein DWI24_08335 [Planctomycetota bacterium]